MIMDLKCVEKLELNKILSAVADFTVSQEGKTLALAVTPSTDLAEVRRRLDITSECEKLLFTHGIGKICEFDNIDGHLKRAQKGSALSCGELLEVAALLRAAREAYTSVNKVDDEEIKIVRTITDCLYFDNYLEDDITEKIISADAVSDYASDKLYSIRSKIKNLNEKIRSKLTEYITGKEAEYLQDAIVTIRNDRFVIPVKAEHKNHVRGFIHDRSKTGATFFIEPEYVLEMNNELIALTLDEREEVEAILRALSRRVGELADRLIEDTRILADLDCKFAIAEYGYKYKCSLPKVNDRGYINIIKGRHPLIDRQKVTPVSVELGGKYNFLLLSGANTGGKTVTLKMCGLFCLMAACGMFIPAVSGSSVGVFNEIFCDIGDSQSIEESLSTFSSHMANIIWICKSVVPNSLVLVDELGGGTNPDEGQALAKAIISHLLKSGCRGIVTTHFTPLKEFAYTVNGIENASMEFDASTLKPLYSIKIGLPGASNALAIAGRLGMDKKILDDAVGYLSEGAKSFENVVRLAEESRVQADIKLAEAEELKRQLQSKYKEAEDLTAELNKEKEKLMRTARSESRRIISEKTARAEEILAEIEEIFKRENITESDLIKARTLKNKLKNTAYDEEEARPAVTDFIQATKDNVNTGTRVYVKQLSSVGTIIGLNRSKDEAEVQCGSVKMHLKVKDLQIVKDEVKPLPQKVKFIKSLPKDMPLLEINVVGLTVGEALYEVDNFIDRAVTDNLEEVKIIHGVGTGKLKNAIWQHLKTHRNVAGLRLGQYGEGETGVTFVKLK